MKTLYLQCNMGAAGDMITAALYGLLDKKEQEQFLDRMNRLMPEVSVKEEVRVHCGISGTGILVEVGGVAEEAGNDPQDSIFHDPETHYAPEEEHHEHHEHHGHHSMQDITAMIDSFDLPDPVKEQAKDVYRMIAEAESKVHAVPVSEVHFHEVGALDAVADITGACYALSLLAPDQVIASEINVGNGNVKAAHGILPVPAPATAEILKGVPFYMNPERVGELCTPTGAALIRTFADSFGPMPAMTVTDTAMGMGKKEFDEVNGIRAMIGHTREKAEGPNQEIAELSANVDDMTGEAIGFAIEKLMEDGALDAFAEPVVMKKSRPGQVFTVLCRKEDADRMAKEILQYTTSFGVRKKDCKRYALSVSFSEKETGCGRVHIKTGTGYGVTKSKTEYEDAAKLARENDQSVMDFLKE